MKTTLHQQKFLVEAIQETHVVEGVRLLRDWLREKGYEEGECLHKTIFRESGACTNCGEVLI